MDLKRRAIAMLLVVSMLVSTCPVYTGATELPQKNVITEVISTEDTSVESASSTDASTNDESVEDRNVEKTTVLSSGDFLYTILPD